MRLNNARERGFAIIMTALLLLILVPVVGLAIDVSVLYSLKARLSTASDAAAIAAARSLNVGISLAEQETAARNRAQSFFQANFPDGGWFTKNHSVVAEVAETSYRTRTVTVTASIDAPTFFMRVLGYTYLKVGAEGKASRRDVNLILVLDRSYSMRDDVAPGNPCTTMRNASTAFVQMFAEGRDRLGLITYGSSYFVGFNPSMTFKTGAGNLPAQLAQVQCGGNTSTAMALWKAYDLIQTINEPGALNLILLFTDGYPNGVTANYDVKMKSDVRYGYSGGYASYNPATRLYNGPTVCNSLTGNCTMEPSPCQDAQGDLYDRNSGATQRQFNSPVWNPGWTPSQKQGVLAQWAGDLYNKTTGDTAGLMKSLATSISQTSEPTITGVSGCAMGGNQNRIRRDVAYMAAQDIYGNQTDRAYKAVAKFAAGHAYENKMRVDVPMAVTGASFNAADHSALRIRSDMNLNPVIYVIGLGVVDHEFNRRASNDPTSPIYDDTRPEGMYVYAPTPAELNYAFVRVASEILRIAN